jgi:hypothetical protein
MAKHSVPAGNLDVPAARERVETTILVLTVWLATAGSYIAASLGQGPPLSTDDAMRLVEVRDFLAGQSWFDLTQVRLSPPEGVVTHWSRLIDLPLAALIAAGSWLLPVSLAEQVATVVWPVGLLLAFLIAVAKFARDLGGETAARLALIFAALMGPVLQHFRPGAIDHHNVQLVLLLWTLVLVTLEPPRSVTPGDTNLGMSGLRGSGHAALAGMLCALSLAIGLEMAPAIAALAGAIALQWVVRGDAVRAKVAAFALALAAGIFVTFVATVPPSRYGVPACDALSIVHVLAASIGGLGLAALTVARGLTNTRRRLAAVAGLGVFIAAMLATAFPDCLGDPYGNLDPRIATLWLANVSEARSIMTLMRDLPQEVVPYYGLLAAGLAFGLWNCVRADNETRWRWINAVCVLAALALVAFWQVRGAAAANAVGAVLVAASIVNAFPAPAERRVFFGLGRAALLAACLVNPLALIGFGQVTARALETTTRTPAPTVLADGPGTCRRPADYAPLADLPRGLVLAFIDSGPFLLMQTPHTILAAPYHRNGKGNAAMLDVFLSTPSEAGPKLAALGVDYIAFCAGAPERYNYVRAAPDGLAAALARGEVPSYLARINLDGTDLAVYRRPL